MQEIELQYIVINSINNLGKFFLNRVKYNFKLNLFFMIYLNEI